MRSGWRASQAGRQALARAVSAQAQPVIGVYAASSIPLQPSLARNGVHGPRAASPQSRRLRRVLSGVVPRRTGRTSLQPAQAANSSVEDALMQRRDLAGLPTTAHGQVISAEANFVRVHVAGLGPLPANSGSGTDSPSPPGLAAQDAARRASHAAASSSSGSSSGRATPAAPPRAQLLCTVRALLKKIQQRVLVGDRVQLGGVDWAGGRGVVEAVGPRSSELADPAIANVSHVLLLFGLTQPPFEAQQVSRFLVSLGASGLPVTLALNKADLLPAVEVEQRLAQVAAWGYEAVAVSCETGQGLGELAGRLAGAVSVVAGPSGAGKSSLINALRLGRHKPDAAAAVSGLGLGHAAALGLGLQAGQGGGREPEAGAAAALAGARAALPGSSSAGEGGGPAWQPDCSASAGNFSSSSSSSSSSSGNFSSSSSSSPGSFLAVGDVSRIGRGRHTTRTVSLIELPFGGLMADSPGFNQPTLDRIASSELAGLFPEFAAAQEAAGGCRFSDCMHLAEPGCAVTPRGLDRHEHYVKFLAEIKAREDHDVRVMQLAKQLREGHTKVVSGRGGVARLEARLDSRKHRSTSRRAGKQRLWQAQAGGEELE